MGVSSLRDVLSPKPTTARATRKEKLFRATTGQGASALMIVLSGRSRNVPFWEEGVYPPVGEEAACKGMKRKRIGGFPLRHDGNDGKQVC
jgi:hypothetical protein